jgi:hypothetical protein
VHSSLARAYDISRVAKNLAPKYNESSFKRERERIISFSFSPLYVYLVRLYMHISIPLEFSPVEQPIEVVGSIDGNKNARVPNTRGVSLPLSLSLSLSLSLLLARSLSLIILRIFEIRALLDLFEIIGRSIVDEWIIPRATQKATKRQDRRDRPKKLPCILLASSSR